MNLSWIIQSSNVLVINCKNKHKFCKIQIKKKKKKKTCFNVDEITFNQMSPKCYFHSENII